MSIILYYHYKFFKYFTKFLKSDVLIPTPSQFTLVTFQVPISHMLLLAMLQLLLYRLLYIATVQATIATVIG